MPKPKDGHDGYRGETKGKKGFTKRVTYAASNKITGDADWTLCEGEALRTLIARCTEEGAAIMFGYSRDRGAYHIVVFDDDGKLSEWIPQNTDVSEGVWNLIARWFTTE